MIMCNKIIKVLIGVFAILLLFHLTKADTESLFSLLANIDLMFLHLPNPSNAIKHFTAWLHLSKSKHKSGSGGKRYYSNPSKAFAYPEPSDNVSHKFQT